MNGVGGPMPDRLPKALTPEEGERERDHPRRRRRRWGNRDSGEYNNPEKLGVDGVGAGSSR